MRLFLTAILSLLSFWGQEPRAAEALNVVQALSIFAAPCHEMGIPEPLARAIAQVESGQKPWALNIEGQGYRFATKEEALAKAQEAWERGQSFDVGLMQVNSWWLKRYNISLEAALDPVANVYFGVWILRDELKKHGDDVRAAVGAYHSPQPARASHYADQVMAQLGKGPTPRKKPRPQPAAMAKPQLRPAAPMRVTGQEQGSMKVRPTNRKDKQ